MTNTEAQPGRIFRDAWIAGVIAHHPGEIKPSYVASWDELPEWERTAAAAVYGQVAGFVAAAVGATSKLSREQKGRFVALCWLGQVLAHRKDLAPDQVADWDDLPEWRQETDADIFEAIEEAEATRPRWS